ncbi:MAG: immunoglobulin domain-containing protein [Chitinivibrionales bacterium]|nr:immunoglobulin domain-containing protein [Chitinivibrionales bacterium]
MMPMNQCFRVIQPHTLILWYILIFLTCVEPLDVDFNSSARVSCSLEISNNKGVPGWSVGDSVQIQVKINYSNYVDTLKLLLGENNSILIERITNGIATPKIFELRWAYKTTGKKSLQVQVVLKNREIKTSEVKTLFIGLKPVFTTEQKQLIASGVPFFDKPFNLKATVTGTEELRYAWSKNGTLIPLAAAAVLDFSKLSSFHQGQYQCICTNNWGRDSSAVFVLNPVDSFIEPQILIHPTDIGVTVGKGAKFVVIANGSALQYQWKRNGMDIVNNGQNSAYEIIKTEKTDDNAQFACRVYNAVASKMSAMAVLHVFDADLMPRITWHPRDTTVRVGQTARFFVEAEGTNLCYSWKKNEKVIAEAADRVLELRSVTTADDQAVIQCIVLNSQGSVASNTCLLRVQPVEKPRIITHPRDITIQEGAAAAFTVGADGESLSYQWYCDKNSCSGATKPVFEIVAVTMADSGKHFFCEVSNSAGITPSNEAILSVLKKIDKPVILKQPRDVEVIEKGEALFSVSASGVKLRFQWQRNDQDITGAADSLYRITAVKLADDNARFRCIVSNDAGSATSDNATLTVKADDKPPKITMQPWDCAVDEGETAQFSIEAEGQPDLAYQWYCNKQPISGANTRQYTTGMLQISHDSDAYVCIVNDKNGKAVSDTARVTVKMKWEKTFEDASMTCVCMSYNGSTFVVISNRYGNNPDDATVAITSQDGVHWTVGSQRLTKGVINGITWDGSQFISYGQNGEKTVDNKWVSMIHCSPDGKNWTSTNITSFYIINSLVFYNNKYFSQVTLNSHAIPEWLYQSNNKTAWTPVGAGRTSFSTFGIFTGSQCFFAGQYNSGGQNSSQWILSSTHGTDWRERILQNGHIRSVSWGGGKYYAAGRSENTHNLYRSDDGENWTDISRQDMKCEKLFWTGSRLFGTTYDNEIAVLRNDDRWYISKIGTYLIELKGNDSLLVGISGNNFSTLYTWKKPKNRQ